MSFEGRYQKVCPNGHYEEQDVYLETYRCSECDEKWERSNLVDDTNEPGEGYDESMVPTPKKPGLRQSFALFLADFKARDSR
jgi:hypothetical protein